MSNRDLRRNAFWKAPCHRVALHKWGTSALWEATDCRWQPSATPPRPEEGLPRDLPPGPRQPRGHACSGFHSEPGSPQSKPGRPLDSHLIGTSPHPFRVQPHTGNRARSLPGPGMVTRPAGARGARFFELLTAERAPLTRTPASRGTALHT